MRFAIIGCGHIAKRHASIINEIGTLTAVCDIEMSKAEQLGSLYNALVFQSINDLINNADFDIAVICTPNGLHAEHSIACLNAKKHVICEKPMALNTADCEKMIQAAEMNDKFLFVVKQNRFNPPVVALKQAIEQKRLGDIISVQVNGFWNRDASYYRQSSWRGTIQLDGGILFTQFSHFIDVMLYLVGDLASVTSIGKNYLHQETIMFEDTGVVNLNFLNGAIGVLHYTINTFEKNMEGSITIFGTKGTVKIGGAYLNEITYQNIEQYELEDNRINKIQHLENDYGTYKGSMSNHDKVYENILEVIKNKKQPIVSLQEAKNTVFWIEKMYQR